MYNAHTRATVFHRRRTSPKPPLLLILEKKKDKLPAARTIIKHSHSHGAHYTHCLDLDDEKLNGDITSSPSRTPSPRKNSRSRRRARAGSEPTVIMDIPWGDLSSSGRKIQAENINMIRRVIASKHIDVNTQNPRDGTTLLMHGIIIGDLDLVEELLKNGADYKLKDNDGDDCIDYALLFQRYKICELLLMVHKKLNYKRLKAITKNGVEAKYMADTLFGKFKTID